FPYAERQPNERHIYSRVRFQRVNELRTAELRKNAQQLVPNYYRLNASLIDHIRSEFLDLHASVKAAEALEQFSTANGQRWALDVAGFAKLKALTDDAGSTQFKHEVETLAGRMAREFMIERPEAEREIRSTAGEIQVAGSDGKF